MSRQPGAPHAQQAGDQDEVARFLVELRALGDVPPPPPSPAVARLLSDAARTGVRRHVARIAIRSALVAAAVLAAVVGAAAGHHLPQPAQRVVSNFVNTLTPFDIAPNGLPASRTPLRTPSLSPHRRHQQPTAPADDSPSSPAEGDDSAPSPRTSSPAAGGEGAAGSGSDSGGGSDDGAVTTTSGGDGGEHEAGDG